MNALASLPMAERLGFGRYLVQTAGAGSFAVGDSPSAMVVFTTSVTERFYLHGPCYVHIFANTSLQPLPDGVRLDESGAPAAAGGTGGAKLPGMDG